MPRFVLRTLSISMWFAARLTPVNRSRMILQTFFAKGYFMMDQNLNAAPTQPGDQPLPPIQPNDPVPTDPAHPEPLPLPPSREPSPPAPIREPDTPMPAGDPPSKEPIRMRRLSGSDEW